MLTLYALKGYSYRLQTVLFLRDCNIKADNKGLIPTLAIILDTIAL